MPPVLHRAESPEPGLAERGPALVELAQVKRLNAQILEAAGEGIYGVDLQGRVTFINPSAARMIGWEADELLGRMHHAVLHHTRADGTPYPRQECPIYAAFMDGKVHHVSDEVFWRRDGSSFPVDYVSTPIREQGKLEGAVVVFRDISNRKISEQALKKSEELLRRYFDAGLLGMAITSPDKGWLQINDTLCEMLGYSRDELFTMTFQDVTHPDDAEHELKLFMQILACEINSYSLEKRCIHKDGHILHVNVSIESVFNEEGGVDHVVAFVQDISERRLAEQALQARVRQQATVAKLGLRALEGGPIYGLLNEVVKGVAGTLTVDVCSVLELLPGGDTLLLRAGIGWTDDQVGRATVPISEASQAGHTLHSKEPVIVEEWQTETRFSEPRLLRDHNIISGLSVIIQGKEAPWGVLGAHSRHRRSFNQDDIHFLQSVANILAEAIENHLAEEQLVQSEEKFRGLLESSINGTVIVNARGDIELVNEQLERMTGYSREELIGRPVEVLVPERFSKEHESRRAGYVARPYTRQMGDGGELYVSRKDGSEFPAEISLNTLVAEEGILITSIIQDISERKRTEQELRQHREHLQTLVDQQTADLVLAKYEAERANQAKSEFLTNMSHELRTPMHAILHLTDTIMKRIDVNPREKTLKALGRIEQSGRRLLALINDLLDLSKLEANQVDYLFEENDLMDILKPVVAELAALIKQKQLALEIQPNGIATNVVCDRHAISQVLVNLLSNAIKFTRAGLPLSVEFSDAELPSWNKRDNTGKVAAVTLSILDRGIGIPEDELGSVFDKFLQSSRTKTGAGGTGLGLAICKEVITRHHGEIWAENNPAGGAIFNFSLPAARQV
ncbi:MAG: PAS domain S-box protein [Gammaproteobacteria bacterium]